MSKSDCDSTQTLRWYPFLINLLGRLFVLPGLLKSFSAVFSSGTFFDQIISALTFKVFVFCFPKNGFNYFGKKEMFPGIKKWWVSLVYNPEIDIWIIYLPSVVFLIIFWLPFHAYYIFGQSSNSFSCAVLCYSWKTLNASLWQTLHLNLNFSFLGRTFQRLLIVFDCRLN